MEINSYSLRTLAGLENVTSVGGNLVLSGNIFLTSLAGLANLNTVGGIILIADTRVLTSLSGLDKLTTVGGSVYIASNGGLTSLAGLDNLSSIRGDLIVATNPKLSACCILSFLVANVSGNITIRDNAPGCSNVGIINATCAVPSLISISYADGSGQKPSSNVVQPFLQINNEGSSSMAFNNITLRYWLTVEEFNPLNTFISWAKLGTNKVSARYVPLGQPYQGAYGYIEYAFSGTDSLAAMTGSGPILSQIRKADWTVFNQADDYSYASSPDYVKNDKITAYYNGKLVWGTEPAVQTVRTLNLQALSAGRGEPATTGSIGLALQLVNTGNTPVSYRDVTVRYWFSAEGSQSLLYQLDYAKMGELGITAKFVKLSPSLPVADTYLELGFTTADTLYPMSNTGDLLQRIRKSDWSGFNQLNDYSYVSSQALALNQHITVYLKGKGYATEGLISGTEPSASGVLASRSLTSAAEPEQPTGGLKIKVLGNPVRNSAVEMMIMGAQGERINVTITDALGRMVSERQISRAGVAERVSLPVDNAASQILYIRVNAGIQVKTVSVVKAK